MKARLISFALLTTTAIATGCFSNAEEEGEEGGADQALSEADCRPKADAEKKKAQTACEKANTFDYAGCMKPAEDRMAKYKADLAAAEAEVKDRIDPITGECKASVDARSCKDILTEAKQDFAAAANDQKACDAARTTRRAKCDKDAKAEIEAALGEGSKYAALADKGDEEQGAYNGTLLSCWAKRTGNAIGGATCGARAEAAYQSAYLACRRECPNIAGDACTPEDDYKDQFVPCGKFTTVSSKFGLFCESGKKCERTAICDKYDSAKKEADKLNKSAGCTAADGSTGFIVAKVTLSASKNAGADGGVPTGVTTVCEPAPSSTKK